MSNGIVTDLFICPVAGEQMQAVQKVKALIGRGLEGDRYADLQGAGSWNRDQPGRRQVTLINGRFFEGTSFVPCESRRSIVTRNFELMRCIGKRFQIGGTPNGAVLLGVQYCYPCDRPSELSGIKQSFADQFHDCGGLVADVVEIIGDGTIQIGDSIFRVP